MALYTEERQLQLNKMPGRTGQVKAITLRRGENDATEIKAKIMLGDIGAFWTNLHYYTAKFKAVLPNGDFAELPCTVDSGNSTVSTIVTNELTAIDGKITVAYFEFTGSSGIVATTDAIPIWIEQDADLSEGQRGEYQSNIDNLVKQLDEYIADARKAAEQANAAKDAADRANDAAQGVEDAAKAANDAAKSANTAASTANSAAKTANDKAAELQRKADNGDFNGATFTPSVSASGDLSWTNNKGLANPPSQNIKGVKGDKGEPGSVTNLASHERVQMFYDYYVLKQQSVTPIIYVYLLGGDELKFSPKPITNHDRPLTASWQIKDTDPAFGSNTAIPWYTDYRTAITSITIEDIIIPKTMQRLFYGLSEIRNLDALAMIDVSNSDNLYGTFNGVSKVSDYSGLRNWNISNMRTIGYAFYNNTSMDSVEYFKNWDTSSVDSMESTFFNCNKVKDFTPINGWNVSKVVSHNSCFTGTTGTRPTWGVNW